MHMVLSVSLAVTSSSIRRSDGRSVSPTLGSHSFQARRLKFGMEVKCLNMCVCVSRGIRGDWDKVSVVSREARKKIAVSNGALF